MNRILDLLTRKSRAWLQKEAANCLFPHDPCFSELHRFINRAILHGYWRKPVCRMTKIELAAIIMRSYKLSYIRELIAPRKVR